MQKPILSTIFALILASLACNVPANVNTIKTGPLETQEINVPIPEDISPVDLELNFIAGELKITPGIEDALVSGTAKFNAEVLRPEINVFDNGAKIGQANFEDINLSIFDDKFTNEWDLQLGTVPVNLTIKAGAYQAYYELGGLAIESLAIQDGAADAKLNFDQPNLIKMSLLSYETGASNVELNGLANANFSEMIFHGGAGDYTLDFTGEFQQDSEVTIEAGISSVEIIVPDDMKVVLDLDGGLSNVDTDSTWQHHNGQYIHSGSGPTLTINIKLGAGNLELTSF